jgi:hypothetical protein
MSWDMTHEANLGKTEKLILISNRLSEDAIIAGQQEFAKREKYGLRWQLQYVWQIFLQSKPYNPKPDLMEAAIEKAAKSVYLRRVEAGELPEAYWEEANESDVYYCKQYAEAALKALL